MAISTMTPPIHHGQQDSPREPDEGDTGVEPSAAARRSDLPLMLLIAPYFLPAYYGGVVQIYLGLIARLTQFQVVVVSDHCGCDAKAIAAADCEAREHGGYQVCRIHAFELHSKPGAALPARVLECIRLWRRSRREWKELLRRLQPDVIVCGGTCSAGWLLRRLPKRLPLLNYIHGEELTMRCKQRFLMPYMRHRQMALIRRADMNIVVSGYTAQLTKHLAGISGQQLTVLPNFVDTTRFRRPADRDALRAKMGWSGRVVVLSVARLDPRKGLDQALRALALVANAQRLPANWLYVIGGAGPERHALETLAEQSGIRDRVQFLGFVPDEELAEIYGAADLFLQPNREIHGDTEGFGIVFLEASACGLPVIGGIAGGTGDAIEHGQTGLRVDAERVDEIADALETLCNDARLRMTMGEQGAARVHRDFSAEAAAQRFESLLATTLRTKQIESAR